MGGSPQHLGYYDVLFPRSGRVPSDRDRGVQVAIRPNLAQELIHTWENLETAKSWFICVASIAMLLVLALLNCIAVISLPGIDAAGYDRFSGHY